MIVSTRDTFGFAQKTTYIRINDGKELKVMKDPKTDTDHLKKSHKGLIFVEKVGNDYVAKDGLTESEYKEYAKTHKDEMTTVFENGVMVSCNFNSIRNRLAGEAE